MIRRCIYCSAVVEHHKTRTGWSVALELGPVSTALAPGGGPLSVTLIDARGRPRSGIPVAAEDGRDRIHGQIPHWAVCGAQRRALQRA